MHSSIKTENIQLANATFRYKMFFTTVATIEAQGHFINAPILNLDSEEST